jgi:hypothetical protein
MIASRRFELDPHATGHDLKDLSEFHKQGMAFSRAVEEIKDLKLWHIKKV